LKSVTNLVLGVITEVLERKGESSNICPAHWLLRDLKERSHCDVTIHDACLYLNAAKTSLMRTSPIKSAETHQIVEVGFDIGGTTK
jgi:hypothetical protein